MLSREFDMQIFNEEQLSHVTSSVVRFLLDPNGNAEGLLLGNGVRIQFSSHLSAEVLRAVRVGDRITVYGLLPMAAPLMAASVIESASGTRIVDDEPPIRRHRPSALAQTSC